ncbi:MAG: hypothetical protein QS98_C0009G0020 [archaeon GW2011_AR3]|nr:MAG: hypothetical protein QS98_C0009G0020 [archaeon GW2011_AR3]MBS3110324.1 hypothetical protein [Candidatus Woesearchaeota archaeon]
MLKDKSLNSYTLNRINLNVIRQNSKMKLRANFSNALGRNALVPFIFLLLALSMLPESKAFPPIAAEYYGNVILDGQPAPAGARVLAYDLSGTRCGAFDVHTPGKFGFLSCNGDDLSTQNDEGATKNENIVFYVNGRIATAIYPDKTLSSTGWAQGAFIEVILDVSQGSTSRALPGFAEDSAVSGIERASPEISETDNPEPNQAQSHLSDSPDKTLPQKPASINEILFAFVLLLGLSWLLSQKHGDYA